MSKDRRTDGWETSDQMESDEFSFENQENDIKEEIGRTEDTFQFEDQERLEAYLSDAIAKVSDEEEEKLGYDPVVQDDVSEQRSNKWKTRKKILVGLGTTVGMFVLICSLAIGWFFYRLNIENGSYRAETDLTDEELALQATLPPRDGDQALLDEQTVNILLIGREGIKDGDGANGRSDSMIIASMNTENKTLKMVSLMRDSYVTIPGYRDNKLNAAFSFGGGELLCETIEMNFGVQLDGYVIVDFSGFKKLVDQIGGVEIELTEREAQYLNTTNYISDKKQRNVVPGKQKVSGTQALGYCRVRKVAAINGENDDYGRTYRQRAVLSQIYSRVKSVSVTEAVNLVNTLLPYVTTNVKASDCFDYATMILQMGIPEIEQMRVPIDGAYSGQKMWCGSSLVLNFAVNNAALQEFIYGEGHGDIVTITPQEANNITTTTSAPSTQNTGSGNNAVVTKAPKVTENSSTAVTTTPTKKDETNETKQPVVTREPAEEVTEPPKATKAPATKAPATKAPVTTDEPVTVVTEAPAPQEGEDDGSVG